MRPPACPYGPDCDASEEPCCNGCASGLGPCYGPGYQLVCLTHDSDNPQEEETDDDNGTDDA